MPAFPAGKFQTGSTTRVLIVGASTRAAAWSAFRGGYRPVCADQFADEDLRLTAEVVVVKDYPGSLCADVTPYSANCWMFVGAMENHLSILQAMQAQPPLGHYCGPSFDAIRCLRNPHWLADRLRPMQCYPEVIVTEANANSGRLLPNGNWLRKPLFGGGGRGIQHEDAATHLPEPSEPCYWQRLVGGVPYAALFLVTSEEPRLLMVSRQLIGVAAVNAPTPFTYCGSLGPCVISDEIATQLTEISRTIVKGLDYRGLLAMDFLWNGRQPWVVEINPRYTSSTELWELATGRSAVAEHLTACHGNLRGNMAPRRASAISGKLLGKLILYADRPLASPNWQRFLQPRDPWSLPGMADIPAAGTEFAAGGPICTVFASGSTAAECQTKLLRRAGRVRRKFRDL